MENVTHLLSQNLFHYINLLHSLKMKNDYDFIANERMKFGLLDYENEYIGSFIFMELYKIREVH